MREQRIPTNGIEVQIRDAGGAGPAVIFLHFSGANLLMWRRAAPFFEEEYRPVLVDLRGHGKSDVPDSGYHMDEMARDVVGIMDQIGLAKAHVVGSSLGAEVGLSLAANYPERVSSLVCDGALSSEFGPYGTWEGTEAAFEAHVATQLEKMRHAPERLFPSLDALVESRRAVFEKIGWWNEYVEAMERYGAYEREDGQVATRFGRRPMAAYMSHYFHYRFEDYYPRVACPLLMVPDADILEEAREREAMEGLCALAPRGRIAYVEEWNHPYGWLLAPEKICREVRAFLETSA
jgi:2-succinyl-6-hydroxy-2,4-cyclohexadiene-1-carboxylate synthase